MVQHSYRLMFLVHFLIQQDIIKNLAVDRKYMCILQASMQPVVSPLTPDSASCLALVQVTLSHLIAWIFLTSHKKNICKQQPDGGGPLCDQALFVGG